MSCKIGSEPETVLFALACLEISHYPAAAAQSFRSRSLAHLHRARRRSAAGAYSLQSLTCTLTMTHSPPLRLAGLDTLRAIAILWVMLFHLQLQLPPALEIVGQYGWMGVDLFFVLSGYLIGLQLLRPYASGSKPSFVGFYRRRIFRILPAYLLVLLLYYVWPAWREQPGISPPWQFLTFSLNYCIDYAKNQAFSHAWSLCVEEHFYLVLPLLLFATMRKPSIARTIAIFSVLVCGGIAIRVFVLLHYVRPAGNMSALAYLEQLYYPTHARLDGLLTGVALALVRTFRPGWWAVLE